MVKPWCCVGWLNLRCLNLANFYSLFVEIWFHINVLDLSRLYKIQTLCISVLFFIRELRIVVLKGRLMWGMNTCNARDKMRMVFCILTFCVPCMLTLCEKYSFHLTCTFHFILFLRVSAQQEAIFKKCSVLIVVVHLLLTSNITALAAFTNHITMNVIK
jgi:hypothetical protein